MRAYKRWSTNPRWAQDEESYLLVGRHTHIFNKSAREWFVVTNAPRRGCPGRGRCEQKRVSLAQFCLETGWRSVLEILCDLCNLRWPTYLLDRMAKRDENLALEPPRIEDWGEQDRGYGKADAQASRCADR